MQKNATGVDSSKFTKNVEWGSLKSDVDKFNIDKLKSVPNNLSNLQVDQLDIKKLEATPVNLSELSNVVKNNAIKNSEYDELVKKS